MTADNRKVLELLSWNSTETTKGSNREMVKPQRSIPKIFLVVLFHTIEIFSFLEVSGVKLEEFFYMFYLSFVGDNQDYMVFCFNYGVMMHHNHLVASCN